MKRIPQGYRKTNQGEGPIIVAHPNLHNMGNRWDRVLAMPYWHNIPDIYSRCWPTLPSSYRLALGASEQ